MWGFPDSVHTRRFLIPVKFCGVNVSYTWWKNTSFHQVIIVMVLSCELWIWKYFFLGIQHLNIMKRQMSNLLTCNNLPYRFWGNMWFLTGQPSSIFLSEGRDWETLVHVFMRDFCTCLLHTAVPVLAFTSLSHVPGFPSFLGCQIAEKLGN